MSRYRVGQRTGLRYFSVVCIKKSEKDTQISENPSRNVIRCLDVTVPVIVTLSGIEKSLPRQP